MNYFSRNKIYRHFHKEILLLLEKKYEPEFNYQTINDYIKELTKVRISMMELTK